MRISLHTFSALVTCSLALLSCEDSENPSGPCDGKPCQGGCQDLAQQGPCNVLDPSCQELIFRAVGCVREQEGEQPPVRMLSKDEQRAQDESYTMPPLDADAESTLGAAGHDAGVASLRIPTDSQERAFALFDLWQERSPGDRVERLGGYYTPGAGITLIDHGLRADSGGARRNLAHEFVHAYQDQYSNLFNRPFGWSSADEALAMTCLIEGEARLYELLAWQLFSPTEADADAIHAVLDHDFDRARSIISTERSAYHDLGLMSYGMGGRHLLQVWLDGGNQAVRALFEAPPLTSVYWMRATANRYDERWLRGVPRLTCRLTPAPLGTHRISIDSLGALYVFAFLSNVLGEQDAPLIEQSWDRALEWQHDSFEAFLSPEGFIASSWRIRFTDAQLARDLAEELSLARPQLSVRQNGAEIELRAAETQPLLDGWENDGSCESAPPTSFFARLASDRPSSRSVVRGDEELPLASVRGWLRTAAELARKGR